jgi:hypothetical protein
MISPVMEAEKALTELSLAQAASLESLFNHMAGHVNNLAYSKLLSGVYLLYTVAAAVTDPLLCINVSVDVPNNPESASVFFLSLNVLCVISIK